MCGTIVGDGWEAGAILEERWERATLLGERWEGGTIFGEEWEIGTILEEECENWTILGQGWEGGGARREVVKTPVTQTECCSCKRMMTAFVEPISVSVPSSNECPAVRCCSQLSVL